MDATSRIKTVLCFVLGALYFARQLTPRLKKRRSIANKVQSTKFKVQSTKHKSPWNTSPIRPFNNMQKQSGEMMFAIRLYVCALTALFLVLVTMDRGVGLLEGIVITCAIVYLILDVRADLQMLKREVHQLEHLERHLAVLLSD